MNIRQRSGVEVSVANSQEPATDTTMVTCAKCRQHAEVREFQLPLLERIRHRV